MNVKNILWAVAGFVLMGIGAIGAVLPLLPCVVFLLGAAFCFAKSSERLNNWFVSTNLYKKNLENYVQGRGMTKKTKIAIMVSVTLMMSIGFFMMHEVFVGRIVLAIVWLCHILYFTFRVKTIKE